MTKAPQAFADQLRSERGTIKDYLQLGEILGRLRMVTSFTDEQNLHIASMMAQAVGLRTVAPSQKSSKDVEVSANRPGPKPVMVFVKTPKGKVPLRDAVLMMFKDSAPGHHFTIAEIHSVMNSLKWKPTTTWTTVTKAIRRDSRFDVKQNKQGKYEIRLASNTLPTKETAPSKGKAPKANKERFLVTTPEGPISIFEAVGRVAAKSSDPVTVSQSIAKFGDLKWKLKDNKDSAAKAIYRKRHTDFYSLYRKGSTVYVRPKDAKKSVSSTAEASAN